MEREKLKKWRSRALLKRWRWSCSRRQPRSQLRHKPHPAETITRSPFMHPGIPLTTTDISTGTTISTQTPLERAAINPCLDKQTARPSAPSTARLPARTRAPSLLTTTTTCWELTSILEAQSLREGADILRRDRRSYRSAMPGRLLLWRGSRFQRGSEWYWGERQFS